jgi:hypothetical protein
MSLSPLILLIALDVCAELLNSQPACGEAEIHRLIRQLGNDSFQQREAASKALDKLGEQILPFLEKARLNPDPEVRHRVVKLINAIEAEVERKKFEPVKRRIEAIKASRLSGEEKGRKLREFISLHMTEQQVEKRFGKGLVLEEFNASRARGTFRIVLYKDCGLRIGFLKPRKGIDYLVHSIDEYDPSRSPP